MPGNVLTACLRFNTEAEEAASFSALNGGSEFIFSEAVSIAVPCAGQAGVDCYWDDLLSGADRPTPAPDGAYHFVT